MLLISKAGRVLANDSSCSYKIIHISDCSRRADVAVSLFQIVCGLVRGLFAPIVPVLRFLRHAREARSQKGAAGLLNRSLIHPVNLQFQRIDAGCPSLLDLMGPIASFRFAPCLSRRDRECTR